MPKPDRDRHYVAGKGSWRRHEDAEAYRENFDRIFRKSCATCARYGFAEDWCSVLKRPIGAPLDTPCGGTSHADLCSECVYEDPGKSCPLDACDFRGEDD